MASSSDCYFDSITTNDALYFCCIYSNKADVYAVGIGVAKKKKKSLELVSRAQPPDLSEVELGWNLSVQPQEAGSSGDNSFAVMTCCNAFCARLAR